jgi:predicted enzyme related to lactoylglutathione lyase
MNTAKFETTMIGSKDLGKTAEFYKKFLSMEVSNPGDGKSFMILKDLKTSQTLMIVADPAIQNAQPSIESENLEETVKELNLLGGKVLSQNAYPTMKVANVEDVDGRKMCIWQSVQ